MQSKVVPMRIKGASPTPATFFIVHLGLEVLKPFSKYCRVKAPAEEGFLYLSWSNNETVTGMCPDQSERYISGRMYRLMKTGEGRGIGALFSAAERHVPFTEGELHVLIDKGYIRLRPR